MKTFKQTAMISPVALTGGSGGGEFESQWEVEDVFNEGKGGTDVFGDFSFVGSGANNLTTHYVAAKHYLYRLKKGIKGTIFFPNTLTVFSYDLTNLTPELFEENFHTETFGNYTVSVNLPFGGVKRGILPEVCSHSFTIIADPPLALFLAKYTSDTVIANWIANAQSVLALKCPKGANIPYYLNKFTKVPVEDFVEIFENLADISGEAEAKTITLGTTILSKLTEEQKDIARAKGWNLA